MSHCGSTTSTNHDQKEVSCTHTNTHSSPHFPVTLQMSQRQNGVLKFSFHLNSLISYNLNSQVLVVFFFLSLQPAGSLRPATQAIAGPGQTALWSQLPRVPYLTSPSIGGKSVDGGLQTEGVVAFVTHVTHKHFGVLSWVPTQGSKGCFLTSLT